MKLTKKSKKKVAKLPSDPSRLAILSVHYSAKALVGCDAVLARLAEGRTELLDSETFTGPSSLEDARSWLEQHLAARTVVMLAGSDVICRTMTLPPASPDQLEMALRLQVENLLLGGAARWRTNASLLPTNDPDRQRIGLMVEWTMSSAGPSLPASFADQTEIVYAPPIAALVALVTGAIAQGSHESLAVYLERAVGAISIAYSDGLHSAFRTLREDGSDPDEWRASIIRGAGETLLLADVPETSIQLILNALRAVLNEQSDGLIAPLSGGIQSFQTLAQSSKADQSWWQRNGILLGTAIALGGPLARIASLKAKAIVANEGILARIISAASTPKTATRIAVAAILILALAPPVLSGGRLAYLQWRLPDAAAYERTLIRSDQQTAMYREYENHAWPMGKLLGDLASATPEGIELESISISQGSPIVLQGSAKPQGSNSAAEAILLMERQLRESRVFDRIEKNWDAPNANGVIKFTINTTVANPSLVPNYPESQDFARRTLRDRRYGPAETDAGSTASPMNRGTPTASTSATDATGEPVVEPTTPSSTSTPSSTTTPSRTSARTKVMTTPNPTGPTTPATENQPSAGQSDLATGDDSRALKRRGTPAGGSAAPDTARRGRGTATSDATVLPPPLTNEQIAAMTQAEAREALGRVSRARGTPGIDDASEARLRAEFYLLLEQAKKK